MKVAVEQQQTRPLVADILLSLWRLLPGNPIVLRVVQGGSKRMQHLWVRLLYLLTLFVVMLVMQQATKPAGDASLDEMAKSFTRVFELIAILQLAMMCFLAPVFTAGAISQEKDAETFNVLLTTPLTNAQIVLGSLMSRLFFVLTLLIAGLPIFCITMLFGGVTGRQIFLSFGIAATTALFTGSLAILISVMRVGTRGTIFSFYVGIALYLAIGLALGSQAWTFVPESIVPGTSDGMTWLALVHPFWAIEVALNHVRAPEPMAVAHYTWPLNRWAAAPYNAYMLLTFLSSVVMVALATFFVRSGVKQGEQRLGARITARILRRGRQGQRRHRVRRVWSNPVAWREAVTRASAASSGLMRYSYISCGVVAGLVFLIGLHVDWWPTQAAARNWLIWLVVVEFMVVLLMAANTAATAITRERDDGTMELLLSTPLTSRYIIWGKLRGLISFAVPLMMIPAATVLAAAVHEHIWERPGGPVVTIISAIILPVLLVVYAAFACMVGLYMSLKSKRSVQAVLASMGLLVGIAFGLGACGFAAVDSTGEIGAMMVPLTFVTAIVYALDPGKIASAVRGSPMTLAEVHGLMIIGTIVAAGLYGAIVAGTYKSMVNNFDMIVRKQSR